MYLYLEDKETGALMEYGYYRKFNALQGYSNIIIVLKMVAVFYSKSTGLTKSIND